MTIPISKHLEALNKDKYVGVSFRYKTGVYVVTFLNYDASTDLVRFQDPTNEAIYALSREAFFEDYIKEEKTSKSDMVNHPPHYTTGKIEVIDFIEDQKLNYHLSSVIKYVCRSPHKENQIEDLKKAAWYLNREIENLQNQVVPTWDEPIKEYDKIVDARLDGSYDNFEGRKS